MKAEVKLYATLEEPKKKKKKPREFQKNIYFYFI